MPDFWTSKSKSMDTKGVAVDVQNGQLITNQTVVHKILIITPPNLKQCEKACSVLMIDYSHTAALL